MLTGYLSNFDKPVVRDEYESSALAYFKRIQSMYLPGRGYTLYPPDEGGRREPDDYCAPLGTRHQLNLPKPEQVSGISLALREALIEIRKMANDAATAYKLGYPPEEVKSCHDAYLVLSNGSSAEKKAQAAAYVRGLLREKDGQTFVKVPSTQPSYRLWGAAVTNREETAYAAATLLAAGEPHDLPLVIRGTNYLTNQMNEAGILYSTVDTAAALVLMIGLRRAGIGATGGNADQVEVNGSLISLGEALSGTESVESVTCKQGVLPVEVTSEVIEDWNAFKSELSVEISLEKDGKPAQIFKVGDALDLVIRVPRYEPCLVAHVCLPDGLARVVGGGQVKRFALDFAEQRELRVPLAAVGPTLVPNAIVLGMAEDNGKKRQPGPLQQIASALTGSSKVRIPAQHWAVIVRNMFKEEQVGNPGLLKVRITL